MHSFVCILILNVFFADVYQERDFTYNNKTYVISGDKGWPQIYFFLKYFLKYLDSIYRLTGMLQKWHALCEEWDLSASNLKKNRAQ
jgi:hypothetical protein